ncbi:MAG TPA: hypothetical protein VFT13_03920 [Candidatus Krumholzibacteria bacterium]|nr:hypothetical protein [Candidatus Krumholzibacteria bacterium]
MDHPAHLAEVDGFARAMGGTGAWGWSDDAFCGFPVALIQSPLWYGLLGGLAHLGVEPLVPYTLLVWLGFLAPALALYRVTRRTLPPFAAGLLAFVLLVQRPALVGFESALAGMWTWHLGLGGLILLAGELSQGAQRRRRAARVAGLVGLIGLTHLMALVAAAALFIVHTVFRALRRRWHDLALDAAAALLGLLASSAFWLTYLLGADAWTALRQDLPAGALVRLLLLPVDVVTMGVVRDLFYTDAIPPAALVALGMAGVLLMLTGRGRYAAAVPLAARGAALALGLFAALVAVRWLPEPVLGPLSWRFLHVVRIGLVLAALPAAMALSARAGTLSMRATLAVVALGSCVWWGLPLRQRVPAPAAVEVAQVESVWRWLREHRANEEGRIIVQDTFGTRGGVLGESHLLALTRARTGIPQVGAWYGAVPFPTFSWTQSEFDGILGVPAPGLSERGHMDVLLRRMRAVNGRAVVVSDAALARTIVGHGDMRIVRGAGNLTVLEKEGQPLSWVTPLAPGVVVRVLSYESGRIRFETDSADGGGELAVHAAWHGFWRLTGAPGARIGPDSSGLIRVVDLPAGLHTCELVWRLPPAPYILALAAWGVIVLLGYGRAPTRAFKWSARRSDKAAMV